MIRRIARLALAAAWIAIIAIAYATLTRVDFVYSIYFKLAPLLMRPEMGTYAHFVHIVAFALHGTLFAFAYPGRILLVGCIVLGGAAVLEIAQTLTPDRHGTLIDAIEKIAGGAAGIMLVKIVRHFGTKEKPAAD